MEPELAKVNKVVGVKQSRKVIAEGMAKQVILASDADPHVTQPIEELCRRVGVSCTTGETMKSLGRACGIDVGAAVIALL